MNLAGLFRKKPSEEEVVGQAAAIPKELLRKVKRIHVKTRRRVDSMMAGSYRSVFKGAGLEFEEVREYSPGDEVKAIDWKVTARMGRPFVKLHREERELTLMILVDVSGSQDFGTGDAMKSERAAEAAAVIAFTAIKNSDKAGAVLFSDRIESHVPPKKGSAHVWRVVREIVTARPRGRGTDLSRAIDFAARATRKRSVFFVISDFLDTGFEKSLARASRRHDVVCVRLGDPGETHLPGGGILTVRDPETGRLSRLDCSSRSARQAHARARRHFLAQVAQKVRSAGADLLELTPMDDPADALAAFFSKRDRRRV